jgi:hypothetical protein
MAKNDSEKLVSGGTLGLMRPKTAYGKILEDAIKRQHNILLRVPLEDYALEDAVRRLNDGVPTGKGLAGVFKVGSLTERNLSDIDTLDNVMKNFSSITEEVFNKKYSRIATRHDDYDFVLTCRNASQDKKTEYNNLLKGILPPPPESIASYHRGYDFHPDVTKTENEWLKACESFDSDATRLSLDRQESQIFDRDPSKNNVPVTIFIDENSDPHFREKVEELLEKGYIQTSNNYLNNVLKKSVAPFKDRFPDDFEEIVKSALGELKDGKYKISHPSINSSALQTMQDLLG